MNASSKQIGIAALLSFGIITAADLQRKKDPGLPSSREWIGLSIAFFFMAAANDLGLDAAGGMAILVATAVVIARGQDAFGYLNSRIRKQPQRRPQNKPPGAMVHPQAGGGQPTQRGFA